MNEIDNEKTILEQEPDFENQMQILEEERHEEIKKRKWYALVASLLLFVVLIFYVSYASFYSYKEYGAGTSIDSCNHVNLKVDGSPVPNLNITDGKSCIPKYNIDYFKNGIATFNIDLYGDKSVIFNQMNQMDETNTYCVINCDADGDGWPDYNIDLNGDGIADINIVSDPANNKTCDLNCDINHDLIPDTNVDTDGDKKADVNVTNGDYKKPAFNVDYMGNKKPTFNIKQSDGSITNPVVSVKDNPSCTQNCDLDGDGWPDYNIKLPSSSVIINQKVDDNENESPFNKSMTIHWRCYIDNDLEICNEDYRTKVPSHKYINIDTDGDGIADVNVSNDGGNTLTNPINKKVNIDGKDVVLNIDANNDGFPDYNIDTDNDGKPDMNIIKDDNYVCVQDCDTNNDGKPDYYLSKKVSPLRTNIDTDYDTKCNVNCDNNGDLIPDTNIDTDGDSIPDINIDRDEDGIPDTNIDTDGDGLPDKNIDVYGFGVCSFNCEGPSSVITNPVSISNTCTKNCDTDGDGLPDKNVDVDADGVCDLNCEGPDGKILNEDKDHDFIPDDKENKYELSVEDYDVVISNPLDIYGRDIEPGWSDMYIVTVKNNSNYAVTYRIEWQNVTNNFTEANNLDYMISRNGASFLDGLKAPYRNTVVKNEMIVKEKSAFKYALQMNFRETGVNQNVDSGKTFKAQLNFNVIK